MAQFGHSVIQPQGAVTTKPVYRATLIEFRFKYWNLRSFNLFPVEIDSLLIDIRKRSEPMLKYIGLFIKPL